CSEIQIAFLDLAGSERASDSHTADSIPQSSSASLRPVEFPPSAASRIQTDFVIPQLFAEHPIDESTLLQDGSQINPADMDSPSFTSEPTSVEASILLEGYVGIEAKEPNLAARPEKPVLRKPG
ncbi:hypothetical protein COOONC_26743, partial [Cooperia oncophora]